VTEFLPNPVFSGLTSGDRHLGFGTEKAKFFHEDVSPFAGIADGYEKGFEELYNLLPPGRVILHATPHALLPQKGWNLLHTIPGVQMMLDQVRETKRNDVSLVPLGKEHIDQMIALTAMTKPGPFGPGTISFGHYYGIFDREKLVAMTGQRLHVQGYTEVSAVCTDPAYLGKGYAFALVVHAVDLIRQQGKIPFLHVRADNQRAIALYERIGFSIQGNMNFYVMKSDDNVV
jgi:ribosomal protein S18 acetylase RimI-like enzyme